MFENQPKGLYVLALANTGERFGHYTMLAIFLLFLQAKFGLDSAVSGQIYAGFLALVYFMPLVGGWVADKWSFSKCVVTGLFIMLAGYAVMAIPTDIRSTSSLVILCGALFLIAAGTGLFKGNLQVMVGDLYNDPRYSNQRDAAFSLFYMAINIGSMFAPMMATAMTNIAMKGHGLSYVSALPSLCNQYLDGNASVAEEIQSLAAANGMTVADITSFCNDYITTLTSGYGLAFAVACGSLVLSFLIYFLGRSTYAHILTDKKNSDAKTHVTTGPELTPAQTKARVVALLLVFAVVIFFWMVFHQNGATLTEFAKSCTNPEAAGWTRIGFNVWALLSVAVGVYSIFGFFQSKKASGKTFSAIIFLAAAGCVCYFYSITPDPVSGLQPQIYQQFNPFFVVALTPVSLAIFSWLASRKKEPSAPRKIGYGMIMAAIAYGVLMIGSVNGVTGTQGAVSPNWLISTYLLLTFAELLLSPMGISFVSKVAPPKLKGSMMGGWFAATAVGNYLVSIPMLLWGNIPVWVLWVILACICLVSAAFIFSVMKKLESATADETPEATVAEGEALAAEAEA